METILLLLQPLLLGTIANAAASTNISLPGCEDSCGNISIPYPFGIGTSTGTPCFREGFEIQCEEVDGKMKAFYGSPESNIAAIDISLLKGQARMLMYLSYACYNKSVLNMHNQTYSLNLSGLPFTISATQNKFTALGCDTLAYIEGDNGKNYESGCVSICTDDTVTNGSCTGTGCCQTSIPDNLVYFSSEFYTNYGRRYVSENYPCSYAFIADKDCFTFTSSDLVGLSFRDKYKDGSLW